MRSTRRARCARRRGREARGSDRDRTARLRSRSRVGRASTCGRASSGGGHHGTSALVGSDKRPFAAKSRTRFALLGGKKRFRDGAKTRANFLTRRFTGLFLSVIQSRKSPKRRSVAAESDKAPAEPPEPPVSERRVGAFSVFEQSAAARVARRAHHPARSLRRRPPNETAHANVGPSSPFPSRARSTRRARTFSFTRALRRVPTLIVVFSEITFPSR